MSYETADFHGVQIAATTPEAAADDLVRRAAGEAAPVPYRLVNAYTLALASHDEDYMQLLRGTGVNLPDGAPLAAVLNRTHPVECRQVRGPQLFEDVLERGCDRGVRHFFLGGSQATLERLVEQIKKRFPDCQIAGTYSPPYRALTPHEIREQDAMVRESGAHLVWVGLGTPKQDVEALRLVQRTGITAASVGAAFDFTAGTKAAAPGWVRHVHLEWLFRLATEPRRLWRRYLFGNLQFLRMALVHTRRTRGRS